MSHDLTPPDDSASTEDATPLSAPSRLTAVLFDPAKAFGDVARHRPWVAALVVLLISSLAFQFAAAPKIDFEQTLRDQLESSDQGLDEAQVEQAVQVMQRFGWVFGVLGALILQPLMLVLGALLFWGIFKLCGSELGFKTSWAVVLHAVMPLVVVSLISIGMVLAREEVDAETLQYGLLASNLSHFAPDDASPTTLAALATVDFFGLWSFVLLGIGYGIATRLRAATVWTSVTAVWLATVVLRVGMTWLGTLFGGGA